MGSRCRRGGRAAFSRTGQGDLARIDAWYHNETRRHVGDLRTGGKGEVADAAAHGRHQADPQATATEKHAAEFARQTIRVLKSALNERAFDELVVVAEPRFLGRLRAAMDRPLWSHVTRTIDKDWTGEDDARLRRHLDSQLDY